MDYLLAWVVGLALFFALVFWLCGGMLYILSLIHI